MNRSHSNVIALSAIDRNLARDKLTIPLRIIVEVLRVKMASKRAAHFQSVISITIHALLFRKLFHNVAAASRHCTKKVGSDQMIFHIMQIFNCEIRNLNVNIMEATPTETLLLFYNANLLSLPPIFFLILLLFCILKLCFKLSNFSFFKIYFSNLSF